MNLSAQSGRAKMSFFIRSRCKAIDQMRARHTIESAWKYLHNQLQTNPGLDYVVPTLWAMNLLCDAYDKVKLER